MHTAGVTQKDSSPSAFKLIEKSAAVLFPFVEEAEINASHTCWLCIHMMLCTIWPFLVFQFEADGIRTPVCTTYDTTYSVPGTVVPYITPPGSISQLD